MKLALIVCDLLTVLLVWRWLAVTGRNEWLMLAYAWNPLVILEVAHSGHLDGLGALWIAACAYAMLRRRTALAADLLHPRGGDQAAADRPRAAVRGTGARA